MVTYSNNDSNTIEHGSALNIDVGRGGTVYTYRTWDRGRGRIVSGNNNNNNKQLITTLIIINGLPLLMEHTYMARNNIGARKGNYNSNTTITTTTAASRYASRMVSPAI